MLWLAAGILFAVFNAGTMLVSQKYKIEGVLMSGLRGVGVAAIYSPAAFFVPFPESPEFWALIVLEGVLSSFFNPRLYASVARFGAGTTSRISMLAVMMIVRKVAMEAVGFESAAVYYPLCAIFLSGAINLTVFALHSGGVFS